MPRLKEVDSLHKLANRILLSSVVQCCKQLGETRGGTIVELREAVAAVKEQILNRMSPNLLAEFSASLINECESFVQREWNGRAVLEMIMDKEIVGLRLTGRIVRYLTSDDAPRLRRLKELDLCNDLSIHVGYERLPVNLGKFYLNDLTLFRYPGHCTDSDLEIIGRNCPNLEVLDVSDSRSVTDAGLRFLSSCPNLRVVNVDRCPKVTHVSLSFLLSGGHKKFEDFSYENNAKYDVLRMTPELDMLSGLDFTVQCPSLTRFVYQKNRRANLPVELKAIVTKFPNLTSFRITCFQVEDLSVIKNLNKLTELSIIFDGINIKKRTWLSLQEALTVIGANLTSFILRGGYSWVQDDVNFIFDSCPNLEYLHVPNIYICNDSLVIPPFPKLKELIIFCPEPDRDVWNFPPPKPELEFGIMLNLENLTVLNMKLDFTFLESMMLDNVKFPKLRVVEINSVDSNDLAKIEQTARETNLDFCARNDTDTCYYYQDPEECSDAWYDFYDA